MKEGDMYYIVNRKSDKEVEVESFLKFPFYGGHLRKCEAIMIVKEDWINLYHYDKRFCTVGNEKIRFEYETRKKEMEVRIIAKFNFDPNCGGPTVDDKIEKVTERAQLLLKMATEEAVRILRLVEITKEWGGTNE